MTDKNFEITGDYRERDEWKNFTKIIAAPNENVAQERAFTVIGSKHNLKRNYIKINAVTLTDGE